MTLPPLFARILKGGLEMRITVPVRFDVESLEAQEELTEREAAVAAGDAAFEHLNFVRMYGPSNGEETVDVHVDGHGRCRVTIIHEQQ